MVLGLTGWQAGWYKIVAVAKDKYGEVKAEKYIQVLGSIERSRSAGSRI